MEKLIESFYRTARSFLFPPAQEEGTDPLLRPSWPREWYGYYESKLEVGEENQGARDRTVAGTKWEIQPPRPLILDEQLPLPFRDKTEFYALKRPG